MSAASVPDGSEEEARTGHTAQSTNINEEASNRTQLHLPTYLLRLLIPGYLTNTTCGISREIMLNLQHLSEIYGDCNDQLDVDSRHRPPIEE